MRAKCIKPIKALHNGRKITTLKNLGEARNRLHLFYTIRALAPTLFIAGTPTLHSNHHAYVGQHIPNTR